MLANSILNLSVETKVDRQQRETVKRNWVSNCETELSVQAECEPIVCRNSFAVCCTRNSWFPGSAHWEDLRKSLLFFFLLLFLSFLSWQLRLVLCVSSFPLEADDVTLRAGGGGPPPPPPPPSSSQCLHLHFPPSSSLPPSCMRWPTLITSSAGS